jgi:hypothetical protein
MTKEKHNCSVKVYHGRSFIGSGCSRNATVERDGKWYCTQHDPVRIEEKRKAETAAWLEESQRRDKVVEMMKKQIDALAEAAGLEKFEVGLNFRDGRAVGFTLSSGGMSKLLERLQ